MHNNLLVLNDEKSEVIHFVSRFKNTERIPDVQIGDTSIIHSTSVRNLGVMFNVAGLMIEQVKKSVNLHLPAYGKLEKLEDFLIAP